ncbi:flippase-like domain-containing protein [Galbibacter sp. BG1]|nr:flippase-like domain-containing protein [Galbibacter sp. BG1]
MTKKIKNILKRILPLLLGVFFIWYSYSNTTASDRQNIIDSIREANYFWIVLSMLMGILSHIIRAVRWNLLLEPLGYRPKIINNVLALLVGYLANLGIPRSGELLRATTVSTYEDIPFQKAFGTIITERIIDVLMLLIIVFITGILQTEIILDYFSDKEINFVKIIITLTVLGVLGISFLYFIKKAKGGFLGKIKAFVKELLEGVLSIFKMKKKWLFLFYTFAIWGLYIFMFWVIKWSLPETNTLSLNAILASFVAGAFAVSATNGGVGLYPIAVSQILIFYGISSNAGDAFGWIMWSAQTSMIVIFGALAFLFLPIYNKNK